MTIHVHVACWNEAQMMPWFLSHYGQFADRIFCHDNGSVDGTRELIQACRTAELLSYDTGDELRDDLLLNLKNNAWKSEAADWVIVVDADELLYSPAGSIREMLACYERAKMALPEPIGFQMIADRLPDYTPGAQLYHHVRHGAADSGYSKRCVFDARQVREIHYDIGSHTCHPVFKSAQSATPVSEPLPILYLLHFKYALGLDAVLRRHKLLAERVSELNRQNRWGHHFWEPETTIQGFEQVQANAAIVPGL